MDIVSTYIPFRELLEIFVQTSRLKKCVVPKLIRPSFYLQEFQMSATERLDMILRCNPILYADTLPSELCLKTFSIKPSVIVFQNYEAGAEYNINVDVQNIQTAIRPMRMSFQNSEYLTVQYVSSKVVTRLAPGSTVSFLVKFTPQQYYAGDIRQQILFHTEGETCHATIMIVSSRPLLVLPDEITIPEGPVRIVTEKVILVKNIGRVPAIFSACTCSPFRVNPEKSVIDSNSTTQLTLEFEPLDVADYKGCLTIVHDTGEFMHIKINSSSYCAKITLDKSEVRFPDTYMYLTERKTLSIRNESNHVVNFLWALYESTTADRLEIKKLKKPFESLAEYETPACRDLLEHALVLNEDDYSVVLHEVADDELALAKLQPALYRHKNFEIIPMTGEIYPGGSVDVTIFFAPNAATQFKSKMYLHVGGQICRLPVALSGIGLGPDIRLNISKIDLGDIYVGEKQKFEVAIMNRGLIPTTVSYFETPQEFGGFAISYPPCIQVIPGNYGCMVIEYITIQTGKFIEDIYFQIDESKEKVKINIRGKTIVPKVIARNEQMKIIRSISFGIVPIAITQMRCFYMENPCGIAINYVIKTEADEKELPFYLEKVSRNDGDGSDIEECNADSIPYIDEPTCGNTAKTNARKTIIKQPEFSSSQMRNFLEDIVFDILYNKMTVKITRPSSAFEGEDEEEEEEVEEEQFELKEVSEMGSQSEMTMETIKSAPNRPYDIGTYLNFENSRHDYFKLPKDPKEFSFGTINGTIPPLSTSRLCVYLKANKPEKGFGDLQVTIPPYEDPCLSLNLCHLANVPDVICSPQELEVDCNVGMPTSVNLELKCTRIGGYMRFLPQDCKEDVFHITSSVSEFYLEENETFILPVTLISYSVGRLDGYVGLLLLGDTKMFNICRIEVTVFGPVIIISEHRFELGSIPLHIPVLKTFTLFNDSDIPAVVTINCPKLWCMTQPSGGILSPRQIVIIRLTTCMGDPGPYTEVIKFTIKYVKSQYVVVKAIGVGTSLHPVPGICPVLDMGLRLNFSPHSVIIKITNKGTIRHVCNWSQVARRVPNMKIPKPFYNIEPLEFILEPLEFIYMTVTFQTQRLGVIDEIWYMLGIVGNSPRREVLMECVFKTTFVEPCLDISKRYIMYSVSVNKSGALTAPAEPVTLINCLEVPVTMEFKIEGPFFIRQLRDKDYVIESSFDATLKPLVPLFITILFHTGVSFAPVSSTHRGYLRGSYLGHPKLETIALYGEIHYPTIHFCPEVVIFKNLPLGCLGYSALAIANQSPLPIKYTWNWDVESLEIESSLMIVPSLNVIETVEEEEVEEIIFVEPISEPPPILDLPPEGQVKDTKSSKKSAGSKDSKANKAQKKAEELMSKIGELSIPLVFDYESKVELVLPLLRRLLDNHFCLKENLEAINHLPQNNDTKKFETFKIYPWKGELKPYEVAISNIGFIPQDLKRVRVKAQVTCEGGPDKILTIQGENAPVKYSISATVFSFGINIFYTPKEMTLTIRNTGGCDFQITTCSSDGAEIPLTQSLVIGVIEISPLKFEQVEPATDAVIDVLYKPGLCGEYNETFIIEIPPLPPISILVMGIGQFPQICFSERRQIAGVIPTSVQYESVASLTGRCYGFGQESDSIVDYGEEPEPPPPPVEIIESPKTKPAKDKKKDIKGKTPKEQKEEVPIVVVVTPVEPEIVKEELNRNDGLIAFTKKELRALRSNGWYIVNYVESFPSVKDIAMTLERHTVANYVQNLRNGNKFISKCYYAIQEAVFQPLPIKKKLVYYVIDFGVVSPNETNEYMTKFSNESVVPVSARLAPFPPEPAKIGRAKPKPCFDQDGLAVRLEADKQIQPSESGTLHLTLKLKDEDYPGYITEYRKEIYVEVNLGLILSIQAQAIVTRAFLKLYNYLGEYVTAIDFGPICYGFARRFTMALVNEGYLPCHWCITLKRKQRIKRCPCPCAAQEAFDYNPFSISEQSGILEPKARQLLNIFFVPLQGGEFSGTMKITVENSSFKQYIPLTGVCVEACVSISDFAPIIGTVVPYTVSDNTIITIFNTWMDEVDVYLMDYDSQIQEENRIIRVVCHYYNVEYILIPVANECQGFPQCFRDLYETIFADYKSNISSGFNSSLELSSLRKVSKGISSSSTTSGKRSKKSARSSKSIPGSGSLITPTGSSNCGCFLPENECRLHEYICGMRCMQQEQWLGDPVKSYITELANEVCPPLMKQLPVIILFYGAPETGANASIYKLGRKASIETTNIDDIIIRGIGRLNSDAAVLINQQIDNMMGPLVFEPNRVYDHIETLTHKIKYLVDPLLVPADVVSAAATASASVSAATSGKTSKKSAKTAKTEKSKKSGKGKGNALRSFKIDLMIEICRNELLTYGDVIVTSVDSLFFAASVAFNVILSASRDNHYPYAVCLYYSVQKFNQDTNEYLLTKDIDFEVQNAARALEIENMWCNEWERLGVEDAELFETIMVAPRTEEYNTKMENRKLRMQEIREARMASSMASQIPSSKKTTKESSKKSKASPKKTAGTAKKSGKNAKDINKKKAFVADKETAAKFTEFSQEFQKISVIVENWNILQEEKTRSFESDGSKKGTKTKRKPDAATVTAESVAGAAAGAGGAGAGDANSTNQNLGVPIHIITFTNSPTCIDYAGLVIESIRSALLKEVATLPFAASEGWYRVYQQNAPKENRDCPDAYTIQTVTEKKIPKIMSETDYYVDNPWVGSLESTPNSGSSHSLFVVASQLKVRFGLIPGECVGYKLRFAPIAEGNYNMTLRVGVVGRSKLYEICIAADCTIPRIDWVPEKVFDIIKTRAAADKLREKFFPRPIYITDENVLDFGCIAINPDSEYKRAYEIGTPLNFMNNTIAFVSTKIRFKEEDASYFSMVANEFKLEPFDCLQQCMFCEPTTVGKFEDTMLIYVKNNPDIIQLTLSFEAVVPVIGMAPLSLAFGRLLMFRKELRMVKLSNSSPVPVLFNVINMSFRDEYPLTVAKIPVAPCVRIFPTTGKINPEEEQIINAIYTGLRVETLEESMDIQILDQFGRTPALKVVNVTMNGECYDVLVDITYMKDASKHHLNFGTILINSSVQNTLTMRNRGKYDLAYKMGVLQMSWKPVILADKQMKKLLRDMIIWVTYEDEIGNIPKGKDKTIDVVIKMTPTRCFTIKTTPILFISLIDTSSNAQVAHIPIAMTAAVVYNRGKISNSEYDYGILKVGESGSDTVVVTNTGTFAVNMTCVLMNPADEARAAALAAAEAASKTDSPKGKGKKEKGAKSVKDSAKGSGKGKKKVESLKVGQFVVSPSVAVILPNESLTINMSCTCTVKDYTKVKFYVQFNNANPKRNFLPVYLSVTGVLPIIKLNNYEILCQDCIVTQTLENLDFPNTLKEIYVFDICENILKFLRVCINHKTSVRLFFKNTGLVEGTVSFSLVNKVDEKLKELPGFEISCTSISVEPGVEKWMEITFTPTNTVQFYEAKLSCTVKLPAMYAEPPLIIMLQGQGLLPQIEPLYPEFAPDSFMERIVFPMTHVGNYSSIPFGIKNVGEIPCLVLLEIVSTASDAFCVEVLGNSSKLLWVPKEYDTRVTTVIVPISECAEFSALYKPTEYDENIATINIFTMDNKLQKYALTLLGDSYNADIVVKDIPTLPQFQISDLASSITLASLSSGDSKPKKTSSKLKTRRSAQSIKSRTSQQSVSKIDIDYSKTRQYHVVYNLEFGGCFLNVDEKRYYIIMNTSDLLTYRLEFPTHDHVTMTPSIAHLMPMRSKQFCATFKSYKNVKYDKNVYTVSLYPITLLEDTKGICWDNSMVTVSYLTEEEVEESGFSVTKRIETPMPEPEYNVIGLGNSESPEPSVVSVVHSCLTTPTNALHILVSGCAEKTEFETDMKTAIVFKDTFIMQRRIYTFTFNNTGNVPLRYKLNLTEESYCKPRPIISEEESVLEEASLEMSSSSGDICDKYKPKPVESEESINKVEDAKVPLTDESSENEIDVPPKKRGPLYDIVELNEADPNIKSLVNKPPTTEDSIFSVNTQEYPIITAREAFYVYPLDDQVDPGTTATVTVVFQPNRTGTYSRGLCIRVDNIDEDQLPSNYVIMEGVATDPYCLLDIPDIYYDTEDQVYSTLRVIEFDPMDIGETGIKTFDIYNCTYEDYYVDWMECYCLTAETEEEEEETNVPNVTATTEVETSEPGMCTFKCLTQGQKVAARRRSTVKFSFTPCYEGKNRAVWLMNIDKFGTDLKFLLIGEGNKIPVPEPPPPPPPKSAEKKKAK